MTVSVHVQADEILRPAEAWDNGAGPMWCYGSRTITRVGETVFLSFNQVDPDAQKLCNTAAELLVRSGGVWKQVWTQGHGMEREPCPLVHVPGRIILTTNPGDKVWYEGGDGRHGFWCNPTLLVFDTVNPTRPPVEITPVWDDDYEFHEHSYRGVASDPESGNVFLSWQVRDGDTYSQAWVLFDREMNQLANGLLRFPMRGCYPNIAVRGNEVHVMAISDEIEPNNEWLEYKREVTGKRWDYDFRQVFYTSSPDVTTTPFSQTLTVASADETAGHITNCDIWLDGEGDAHLLYQERNSWHVFMRDRFFPDMPLHAALKTAHIHKGRVIGRKTLMEATETAVDGETVIFDRPDPQWGAFHGTPDGSVFVVHAQTGIDEGVFIRRYLPEVGDPVSIPLERYMPRFFTNSPRSGCALSNTLDLVGPAGDELRYAEVEIDA